MAPSLILTCIHRLPDTSLTTALASGGREHFGWGQDRHLAADLYDAITLNTRASGNWGKTVPDIPDWPRPTTTSVEEKKRPTVKDLWQRLSQRR